MTRWGVSAAAAVLLGLSALSPLGIAAAGADAGTGGGSSAVSTTDLASPARRAAAARSRTAAAPRSTRQPRSAPPAAATTRARPAAPARRTPAAGRASGFLAGLSALLNNQTPQLSPTQNAQSPAGVVSGALNAVDPDSERLSFTIVEQPSRGTAEISADGTWTYTPDPAQVAGGVTDTFEVEVSDAPSGFAIHGLLGLLHLLSFGLLGSRGDSSTATVTAVVAPVDAPDSDYREDMRRFVIDIADQARAVDPGFIVIPQNGQELLTLDGTADGPLAADYAAAITGQGREDLFYGYDADNVATPAADRDYLLEFLERDEAEGVQVLVTDYCSSIAYVDNSYAQNAARDFISFAADHRELDSIPPRPAQPYEVNSDDVVELGQARNFLYLLNPGSFASRADYLSALDATNYDMFVIDAFYDDEALTAEEVAALQTKANGGRRLVIAYLSIGEAEDYRYYWQPGWRPGSPAWLAAENPDFAGNYKVRYWEQGWRDIILDGPDSYLNRITAAGFDGAYLDLIDAFEYFE